jgi:hypothetical protein
MANFDIVDLTKPGVITRGGDYQPDSLVGTMDTVELAHQLQELRSDLSSVLDDSEKGIGLKSIVIRLTVGADGRVAFIAKGSVLDVLAKSRLTKINNDTSESEVMTPAALTA